MLYARICAAAVMAAAVFFVMVRYFRTRKRRLPRALIIIPVLPDDELFERRVRSCYWEEIFADAGYSKDILLVVSKPCANMFMAKRLAQEYSIVHSIHISSLEDYIIRNYTALYGGEEQNEISNGL